MGDKPIEESVDGLRQVRGKVVAREVDDVLDVLTDDLENVRRLVDRASARAGDKRTLSEFDAVADRMIHDVRGLGADLTAVLTDAADEIDALRRPVIHVSSTSTADRPVLRRPPPGTVVELDQAVTYTTDEQSRVIRAEATLTATTPEQPRNRYAERTLAGKLPEDDAGHLIARILGGIGHKINLVPMTRTVNRGQYASLERRWRRAVEQGKPVDLDIELEYDEDTRRPSAITVTYRIAGRKPRTVSIENDPPEENEP